VSDVTVWGIGTIRVHTVATMCERFFDLAQLDEIQRVRTLDRISELLTNDECEKYHNSIWIQDREAGLKIEERVKERLMGKNTPVGE
jgi:hypothetical protein